MKLYIDLFLAFFRPGIFGFGGGPSAIPLIQEEVINNYGWMTVEEYIDAVALGNSLPGPIATKLAALIGYKVGGIIGSIITLTAMVLPTALAMILLYQVYSKYKEAKWLKNMMVAVKPVVVILLIETVITMGQKSFPITITWIIGALAALGLFYFKIHPAILIVTSMVFGVILIK
ncbi:MAG: chromate transporter [Tissierellia bacterium]|nr:chromate transporter [Tissierellia bacterium]